MPIWAARYDTWLLIELTPKGVVFSLQFFSLVMPTAAAVMLLLLSALE